MDNSKFDPSDHYTMWSDGSTTVCFQNGSLWSPSGERVTAKRLSDHSAQYDMVPQKIRQAIIAMDESVPGDELIDLDQGLACDPKDVLQMESARLNRPSPNDRFLEQRHRGIRMVHRINS